VFFWLLWLLWWLRDWGGGWLWGSRDAGSGGEFFRHFFLEIGGVVIFTWMVGFLEAWVQCMALPDVVWRVAKRASYRNNK